MKCYSYTRFSTPDQAKGRSRERQIEAARAFVNSKGQEGWELDENLCMHDAGMSAFHGEHTSTTGALGIFLAAVEAGKIPIPSALIVENLDRLSRDTVLKAFRQFTTILEAGITVVTLMDNQVYTKQSIESGLHQLLISLSVMSRAHEESRTKQLRRADTWQKSRDDAKEGKIVNARCAAWLKVSEDKTKFELIPERVAVVQRIYSLYVDGHGFGSICSILNKEGVPTFSANYKNKKVKNTWGVTSVHRIIKSRTVLGEIQFMKTAEVVNGKRKHVPAGEPIANYYPQIIDNKTFYKAREINDLKRGAFGKIGKMNNLFSGLVKCGHCGATMEYGIRSLKKIKYLNCRNSKLGRPCHYASFRYQDLEDVFLKHCTRWKLSDIISDDVDAHKKKLAAIEAEILAINGMLEISNQKITNWGNAIGAVGTDDDGDTIQHFAELIKQEKANQRDLTLTHEGLERDSRKLENQYKDTKVSLSAIQDTVEHIGSAVGEERETIRRRLQKEIRALVERIDIFPRGVNFHKLKAKAAAQGIFKETDTENKQIRERIGRRGYKYRQASVHFRGGGILSFAHDHETERLKVMLEIEPSEDEDIFGTITRSDLKKVTKLS